MHTDYFAVLFDFERDILRRKKAIEDVEKDSRTIYRLRVFFYYFVMERPFFLDNYGSW
jgi:hypothetical protein